MTKSVAFQYRDELIDKTMQPFYDAFNTGIKTLPKKTEHTGPLLRVVKLQHDDWCYIVPAIGHGVKGVLTEIEDYGGDDQLEYHITFLTMPQSEYDALPEFNG